MADNLYECMFLLDTSKVAGDVPGAAEKLHGMLKKYDIEPLVSRFWEERRLAYPIGNNKKGIYYLIYFRSDGAPLKSLEHDFRLSDLIIRTMTLKIVPHLEETMLALARDESALVALRNYTDEDDIKPNRPSKNGTTTDKETDKETGKETDKETGKETGEVEADKDESSKEKEELESATAKE